MSQGNEDTESQPIEDLWEQVNNDLQQRNENERINSK